MKQQTFIKDISFILSAPLDYGIEPPEGKTHEDFIGWHGCDPNKVNYNHDELPKCISAYTSMKYTRIDVTPCYYPVWNMYGWALDLLSTEFYVNACSNNPTIKRTTTNSSYYNSNYNNRIHAYNSLLSIYLVPSHSYSIYEGSKIHFLICNSPGKKINNVYLNGQLFAGISVDKQYYEEHIDSLYKFNYSYLSNLVIWNEPLSVTDGRVMLEFNITSCHVSSDNLIHISCDVETIGGTYNLYESLDDSL